MIKDYKRPNNLSVIEPMTYDHISRYQTYNRIVDLNNNESYLETANDFNMSNIISKYHIVEPIEEGRLDMISQIYYGDPQYYWIIAIANNIIDPLTVLQGSILKIPDMDELYFSGGPLVSRR